MANPSTTLRRSIFNTVPSGCSGLGLPVKGHEERKRGPPFMTIVLAVSCPIKSDTPIRILGCRPWIAGGRPQGTESLWFTMCRSPRHAYREASHFARFRLIQPRCRYLGDAYDAGWRKKECTTLPTKPKGKSTPCAGHHTWIVSHSDGPMRVAAALFTSKIVDNHASHSGATTPQCATSFFVARVVFL
jgi:hypothetical protein